MTEKHSPLDQFTIQRIFEMKIGNIDISLTNSSLMMIAVLLILNVFLIYATKKKSVVPGRLQSIAEMSYEMIYNTTQSNLGNDGKRLFP